MADTALVVPVQLDALVVNQGVYNRDRFNWWPFDYLALQQYRSPESGAGGGLGPRDPGIYLHWTLPAALRHGIQKEAGGPVEYPLVPNRWLVVRYWGADARQAKAWVVESDCPYNASVTQVGVERTSMYLADPALVTAWQRSADSSIRRAVGATLKPDATDPQVVNIGIPFPLKDWSERDATSMFLKAVAPGNAAFSMFVPHNYGIFSFYDDLAGIDKESLSYLVVGWFSDPSKDILVSNSAASNAIAALLESLHWTVAGDPPAQARTSLYQGMALAVSWDRNGPPPGHDPLQEIRDTALLNVAIGNSTIDAFSALVSRQLAAQQHDTKAVTLLRALQYDLLPLMNQVNGPALLEQRIHQAAFGSDPGGYQWRIVPRDSDDGHDAPLTDAETQWLLQLNHDQLHLDAALRLLFDLRWRLNALWWKKGVDPDSLSWLPDAEPVGVTNAELAAQLDPAKPDSLAAKVLQQLNVVNGLLPKVPQPVPGACTLEEAFRQGIEAFAKARGLSQDKALKAEASPRFWKAGNPVVALAGVQGPLPTDPGQNLPVRLASDLITGVQVGARLIDVTAAAKALPLLDGLSKLSPTLQALYRECFFLDAANAGAIAKATGLKQSDLEAVVQSRRADSFGGRLPALGLESWHQVWQPLYLRWRLNYAYIPHQWWRFDGNDYHFVPAGKSLSAKWWDVSGTSQLNPSAQFVFGATLKKFVEQYGAEPDLTNLYQWLDAIGHWQYLTQELVGFRSLLAQRDERAFRRPDPHDPIARLLGYTDAGQAGPVAAGQIDAVPYLADTRPDFHGVCEGQMIFKELYLYDKFGRVLKLFEEGAGAGLYNAQHFPLIIDKALIPDEQLTHDALNVAELPPRVLQGARLEFDLVDGADDRQVLGLSRNVNPVCGWVLPNHLDHSILVYAPDGTSLGEFRLVVDEKGRRRGVWAPPPHSQIATLDDVGRVAPHLRQMLAAVRLSDQANFDTFLDAIDSTLWTTDPLGERTDQNLSVLVGRPLALVRAQLQLRVDGPPRTDTGWAASVTPPPSDLPDCAFAVRLGDLATRQDGVIGYFLANDYETFNSVVDPAPSQTYVKPIGPLGTGANYIQLRFAEENRAYVSLLVDPRASIHATTGILPVKEVTIPARFVDPALAQMEVGFRITPVLTRLQPSPKQGDDAPAYPNSITYPFPAETQGLWSWWEQADTDGHWTGNGLIGATPNAGLQPGLNTLREGILQLIIDGKRREWNV